MSFWWVMQVSGVRASDGARCRERVEARGRTRADAMEDGLKQAAYYGLTEVTVEHLAQRGHLHTVTFAESTRGKQRRAERRFRNQVREGAGQ